MMHTTTGIRGAALRSSIPFVLFLAAGTGCEEQRDLSLPSPAEVENRYAYEGSVRAEMSGNVAEVTVEVPPAEFERGGSLWARSVPYLFLFSEGTRELFEENPGLAGVRVVALDPGGDLIAEALLERTTLTSAMWRRALNITGRARTEGTESPARVRDLVNWGEDHTEFRYNPRYVPD